MFAKLLRHFPWRRSAERLSHSSKWLFRTLKRGDLAIDCGANVGNVCAKMAERGAIVHAFEPNPYAFEVLRKRFAGVANVNLHNQAVHIYNGHTRLFLHRNAQEDQVTWSTGSSVLECKQNVDADNFVEVEVIDIVDFIRRLGKRVRLMKMDVEGVECPIVNKLIDTGLVHAIDRLLVETHEKIPSLVEETKQLRRRVAEIPLPHVSLDWI